MLERTKKLIFFLTVIFGIHLCQGAPTEDRAPRFLSTFFDLIDSFIPSFNTKRGGGGERADYLVWEPDRDDPEFQRSSSVSRPPALNRRQSVLNKIPIYGAKKRLVDSYESQTEELFELETTTTESAPTTTTTTTATTTTEPRRGIVGQKRFPLIRSDSFVPTRIRIKSQRRPTEPSIEEEDEDEEYDDEDYEEDEDEFEELSATTENDEIMKMVESQQDNFNNINQINRRIENDDDETIEFAKTEKYPKKKPIFKIPNRFNKLKGSATKDEVGLPATPTSQPDVNPEIQDVFQQLNFWRSKQTDTQLEGFKPKTQSTSTTTSTTTTSSTTTTTARPTRPMYKRISAFPKFSKSSPSVIEQLTQEETKSAAEFASKSASKQETEAEIIDEGKLRRRFSNFPARESSRPSLREDLFPVTPNIYSLAKSDDFAPKSSKFGLRRKIKRKPQEEQEKLQEDESDEEEIVQNETTRPRDEENRIKISSPATTTYKQKNFSGTTNPSDNIVEVEENDNVEETLGLEGRQTFGENFESFKESFQFDIAQEVTENDKETETIVQTILEDTPAAGGADSIESESVINQAVKENIIKEQKPEDDFISAFVPLGESSTEGGNEVPVISVNNLDEFIKTPETFSTFEIAGGKMAGNNFDIFSNGKESFDAPQIEAEEIPAVFKTPNFVDDFSISIMNQVFDDNLAMEDTHDTTGGRIQLPEDLTMSKPEMDLLNKMLISDSLSQTELDQVKDILEVKMAAMQNVLNHQSSSTRTIPQHNLQTSIADFSPSSLPSDNGGFANFPIVLQLPEGDCPKYCLNIKVEVTRLGRSLTKTCRNTPLCSANRRK